MLASANRMPPPGKRDGGWVHLLEKSLKEKDPTAAGGAVGNPEGPGGRREPPGEWLCRGHRTWQPSGWVVMIKRLGVPQVFHGLRVPQTSHPDLGTAANGAVTQKKNRVHAKRTRPADPTASPVGEVSKALQLDGAWPWSRHFLPKPNVQWFGTQ